MTTNEQTDIKKKKTPKIVTWLSATVALMAAGMKASASGEYGLSPFFATFFTHFLVAYFIIWAGSKLARKFAGEEGKAVTVSAIVASILVFFLFAAIYSQADEGLPECASEQAIEGVRSVLEDGANSKLVKVELLDISAIQEFETSQDKTSRTCVGIVTLNTGEAPIKFRFYFAKSDQSRVLIDIKELDALGYALMHEKANDNEKEAQKKASEASGQ